MEKVYAHREFGLEANIIGCATYDFKDSNKPEASYEEYDSEIQQMMEEMKALAEKLKKSGLSEHLLEKLIHGDEKMSRLYITKDYRLFLLDYRFYRI